ncbi:MAG: hypothetical protein ACLFNX_04710 [Spirochaetaceae bacterium]
MSDTERDGRTPESGRETETDGLAGIFEESEHGVSEQEKAEIQAQLETLVRGGTPGKSEATLHYEARHRRDILPPLIGIGAIIAGAIAAVTLFVVFDRQEQTLLADAAAADSTEAQLLAEFRAEAEERLSAQEGEIDQVRSELDQLERERDEAVQEAEAAVLEREAELEKRLEEELAAERARLEEQGLSEADVDARLAELEEELEAEHSRQLEDLREEYRQAIAEREEQLEAMESEHETDIARLSEQRSREERFASRLTDGYREVLELLDAGEYAAADTAIEELRELLGSEQAQNLPAIRNRAEMDREVLSALGRLGTIEQDLASARRELRQVESTRDEYRQTAAAARARNEELRQEVRAVREEVRTVQNRLAEEAAAAGESRPEMGEIMDSVDVRLEVLEALRSDPVRSEHPELDEQFEAYLDAFARVHEQEGFAEALAHAVDLLEGVAE